MTTEQALVEAMARIRAAQNGRSAIAHWDLNDMSALLAALRAALPENTVLTSEGVARVGRVAWEWANFPQGEGPMLSYRRALPDSPDDLPLYTLTLENET